MLQGRRAGWAAVVAAALEKGTRGKGGFAADAPPLALIIRAPLTKDDESFAPLSFPCYREEVRGLPGRCH